MPGVAPCRHQNDAVSDEPEPVRGHGSADPLRENSVSREVLQFAVPGFIAEEPVAWPNRAAPNMAAAFGSDGELIGVTYKVHPVLVAGETWGGTTPQIYPTFAAPFGALGMIVCFDATITDANGQVMALSDVNVQEGEQAVLVADVHLGPRDAPFTVLGGMWFGVLVLLAAAARYIWQFILWRRSRRQVDSAGVRA